LVQFGWQQSVNIADCKLPTLGILIDNRQSKILNSLTLGGILAIRKK
jgi:hypothetical protein